ncbi:MAG: PAS domain S-box protein [Chloroflexota bacterium]
MTSLTPAADAVLIIGVDEHSAVSVRRACLEGNFRPIPTSDLKAGLRALHRLMPAVALIDYNRVELSAEIVADLRDKSAVWPLIIIAVVPGDEDVIQDVLAMGVDDCIRLPVSPTLLRHLLQRLTGTGRFARSNGRGGGAEQRYRHVFDGANDAILITDLETGTIVDANRRAVTWLGYEQEELIGMQHSVLEADNPNGSAIETDTLIHRISTGGQYIFEQHYRARDGRIIPAEVSSRFFIHRGQRALLHFVRDITQRKAMEEAERSQRRMAEALADTAAALNSTLKPEEVIQKVLWRVIEVLPANAANLMLIDGNEAYTAAHVDTGGIYNAATLSIRWTLDKVNNLHQMMTRREPVFIPDTDTDLGWHRISDQKTIRSYVGAPLVSLSEDRVIGFINLDSKWRRWEKWR